MDLLVGYYETPLYHAAYRLLGNAEDAADITQTAFLKVFRNLGQYRPSSKFFSWIYRIAINEALDLLRRGGRLDDGLQEDPPGVDQEPVESVAAAQRSRGLQRALMTLNADDRTVLVLHYYGGCSYAQMAQILEVPEKTVKSRLFTARQRLKELLERSGMVTP